MRELVCCDTPPISPKSVTVTDVIASMTSSRRGIGGRPSKGDRRMVGSRMPISDADKLHAVAAAQGVTVSDYVADLVRAHLRNVDLDGITNQEALLIARAS